MVMKLTKKGISPLIATVLIIGFTVALAAVIMTWGSSFTKGMQKTTEESTQTQLVCAQEVSLSIKSACIDKSTSKLQVTLENKGSKDIIEAAWRFFETASKVEAKTFKGADLDASENAFKSYAISSYEITQLATPTKATEIKMDPKLVTQIEIIPSVTVSGKKVTCAGASAKYGEAGSSTAIGDCSGTGTTSSGTSCTDNSGCSGTTPICVSSICSACTTNAQCVLKLASTSATCDTTAGTCS
jgi:flagellin-like protein